MSDADTPNKPKDPDGVYVSQGQQDHNKDKVYVWVQNDFRDARAAIKAAGGVWKGSNHEFDKDAFAAVEATIREAARKDIALGKEGRVAREAELNPEKAAQSAEKRAAKEAEKAAKSAAWEKAKAHRVLVKDGELTRGEDGAVVPGQQIGTKDGSREVTSLGTVFAIDEKNHAKMSQDFPDAGVEVGDKVAYAYYAAPEPEGDAPEEPKA